MLACDGGPTPAQLYTEHCASCHGADGRGDPRRRGFYAGLDLTASPLVQEGRDGLVYRRIAYGYGAMPGFQHKLDTNQLLGLTEYTLQFSATRSSHEPGTLPRSLR